MLTAHEIVDEKNLVIKDGIYRAHKVDYAESKTITVQPHLTAKQKEIYFSNGDKIPSSNSTLRQDRKRAIYVQMEFPTVEGIISA